EAARDVFNQLTAAGLRASMDERSEKIGYKIREAQMQKLPYMLIIGEKEAESGAVSVRKRGEGDLGAMPLEQFIAVARAQIAQREIFS
ncbi:MAG: threonine--tRNA ligase, partial [Oscillospiraceae bacterium]|nr:threonine--tRNA ligase [Oscillospiraceae bacterium]